MVSFDLHVQLFAPIHTAIHITGKNGRGVISNTWVWAGTFEHNPLCLCGQQHNPVPIQP